MRRKTVVIFLLLFFLVAFCSKSNDNTGESAFTIEGTVFVDQNPASNILVEFGTKPTHSGLTQWHITTKYSDENGKYSFTANIGQESGYGMRYRVRVKNPITTAWTDYREKTAAPGITFTENFFFSTSQ